MKLTDADRAYMATLERRYCDNMIDKEDIYIDGMKAMAERCAVACETGDYSWCDPDVVRRKCAAACRALAKEGE